MQNTNISAKSLLEGFERLKKNLDLDKKKKQYLELEAKTLDPALWDNQENARSVMQEFGDLKKEIEDVDAVGSDIKTLVGLSLEGADATDFAKEIAKIKKALKKLEIASFLSGKYDKKHAIVSIHAGQGGTEAMDWTSMLYRMYRRYFEKKDWKVSVVDLTSGEEAGIKSVTIKVEGAYAYGFLRGEVGTHRLVRQSPFNADKLRQTSFARVEVLPKLIESDEGDIVIKDEDLDWQFYRSSGSGGQNVNKVSTAVRLLHKPSGIVVTSQAERYQEKNRAIALNLLRSKLWIKKQEEDGKEVDKIKGEYRPASWGTQIRSYVLHPYKMVKDLRTKVETSDTESVLDGDLDSFIEAEISLQ